MGVISYLGNKQFQEAIIPYKKAPNNSDKTPHFILYEKLNFIANCYVILFSISAFIALLASYCTYYTFLHFM